MKVSELARAYANRAWESGHVRKYAVESYPHSFAVSPVDTNNAIQRAYMAGHNAATRHANKVIEAIRGNQ